MVHPSMLIDEPEQVDDLLWPGLAGFAARLAQTVSTLPASCPVLLSGDWGSGKTTLLHALRRAIDAEAKSAEKEPRPGVWFDAWRYEGEKALLPALLRTIWEATPDGYRKRKEARSLFGTIWRLSVAVGTRLMPALFTFAGAPVVGEALKGLTTSALSKELTVEGDASFEPPVDAPRLLWAHFATLVADAWDGRAPIILIDDLDRCSPDGAVALLDGIRMLVSGGSELKCNFVVAMDRGVVAGAVSRKFAGISGYDGNRYLEKIFPVSFAVPTPYDQDATNLVTTLLGPPSDPKTADHRAALSLALSQPLFANPRLMKRCINKFQLVLHYESSVPAAAQKPGAAEIGERDRALAKWIAATERWPILRPMMTRYDARYWDEVKGAVGAAPGPISSPELLSLLGEQGAADWLREVMFTSGGHKLYKGAETRMRRWGV